MYKTVEKEVTRLEKQRIPVCDFCGKETKDYYGGCPSESPILPLFVGFTQSTGDSGYSQNVLTQQYGLSLGDVCMECREAWFKDLQERYPSAKLVKYND